MILPNSKRVGTCACGTQFEQTQIDPDFLNRRAQGTIDILRREFAEDADGKMFIPKHCSAHQARGA